MRKPEGIAWSEWKRRQCCERKVRHETWEAARVAGLAAWLENPKPQMANPPTPYPCSVIGEPHYHCGHLRVRLNRTPAA